MAAHAFIAADDLAVLESPEDVLTTLRADGKRKWLFPVPSKGRYHRRRLALGWGLIALFVALPVVRIGGKPAVLLDVVAREFTLFGFTFYPTDTFLLLLFGLSALVAVALLTALFGRVWCGWGCPQTVYMEFLFRPIERWIEGPEHVRARRAAGPWTVERAARAGAKLAVYLWLSLLLAHVFVSYFAGWERLLTWVTRPPAEQWGFFVLMSLTTGLIFYDFGYFREQMCTIACPYARFQSVLMDEDSLIVSYDPARGEPRGKGKARAAGPDGRPLGDCIDCLACVRTCPTGIDIRDGLQMECIACTQCIDACDAIMLKVGKPPGLIRYTSEHELARVPTRVLRPRTALYGLLLVALLTGFTVALASRDAYEVTAGRAAGAPFVELPDGTVANRLVFRLRNRTPDDATLRIAALAPEGAEVRVVGVPEVALASHQHLRVEAFVVVPRAAFGGSSQIEGRFALRFDGGVDRVEEVALPLLGPSR